MNVIDKLFYRNRSVVQHIPYIEKVSRYVISYFKPESIMVWGNRMYLDTKDELLLSVFHEYEPLETSIFQQIVKKGNTVVDVGAHIGYYTLLSAKIVGKRGIVYAFEPDKSNYALLQKNIRVNNYQNVISINKALDDHVMTLDNFLSHRKTDVVKVDTDGHEVSIIKGMRRILCKNKHVVLFVEFWPFGLSLFESSGKELLDLLAGYGFIIYQIDEKRRLVRFVEKEQLLKQYESKKNVHTNLVCVRDARKVLMPSLTSLGVYFS